jgi:serine/threonine-protein kinase
MLDDVIGRASGLLDKGDYAKAEALLRRALEARKSGSESGPPDADLLAMRGQLAARQGHYKEAVADISSAMEASPSNHVFCHWLAPALVADGDIEGYRRCCEKILARFGGATVPAIAERMAKACLILPSSGVDPDVVGKMAQTAVSEGMNAPLFPYFQFAKGLAEYRQGRFASAVDWTGMALKSSRWPDDYRDIQAYSVLAMARYQLKQIDEARQALANGTDLASRKLPKADSGNLGPNWNDWILADTLLREAKGLIEGK